MRPTKTQISAHARSLIRIFLSAWRSFDYILFECAVGSERVNTIAKTIILFKTEILGQVLSK